MTEEENAKIIVEYLATKEGRDRLAEAMTKPLRTGWYYNEKWRLAPDVEENRNKK